MSKLAITLSLFIISLTAFSGSTHKQYSNNVPKVAMEKLISYLGDGRDIDVMQSTKEGHWIITGKNVRYFSNTRFFNSMRGNGSMPLRQKINEYMTAGRRIDALGITSDNNWVITSGNFRYYSSASKFDNMGLRRAIERELKKGRKITQIAIDRNKQWAIIAGSNTYYSSRIPRELKKAIIDSRVQKLKPRILKFKPNSLDWIYVAGQRVYVSKGIKHGLKDMSEKYSSVKWQTDKIFITPNGGWSVISNKTVPHSNEIISKLESNIKDNSNLIKRMKHHKANSVSLLLIDNGRVVMKRAYGFKDEEKRTMSHTDTIYPVASMSKAVGSFVLSYAASKDVISMKRPINDYLQSNRGNYLGHWGLGRLIQTNRAKKIDRVNMLGLLSHTAGFNKHGIGVEKAPFSNLDDVLDGRYGEVVKFIHNAGEEYDYSGGGYAVAESILDVEQSSSATAYMNAVLSLLSMRDSTFGSMENDIDRLARMHNTEKEVFLYRECPVKTAGGLFSTTTDYFKFVYALMNNGQNIGRQQILDTKSVHTMMTPRHKFGSSLRACTTDSACSSINPKEVCVAKSCMQPFTSGSDYIGLGLKLEAPFNAETNLPRVIKHGGAQKSTRTEFRVNLDTKQGIIVFVSGPRKWKNTASNTNEPTKGAGKLVNEIVAKYRSLMAW